MRFKIDENLPVEAAGLFRDGGFDADTVGDEAMSGAEDSVVDTKARREDRVLITQDLDFANIRAYPPEQRAGIVVIRSRRQDKYTLLALVRRVILAMAGRSPARELWIVEPDRIRFRR